MTLWCVVLLISVDFFLISVEGGSLYTESYLKEGRSHVCKNEWYEREKYHRSCSFWKWGRCTAYRSKKKQELFCCSGYSTYHTDYTSCSHAICANKLNPTGACNVYYGSDYIMYRTGQVVRNSGGSCNSPESCSSCNDGFYSDGPKCSICPAISNCYHRRCTNTGNNQCLYCHGEILEREFWRAYTPAPSGRTQCQKACSWRSDSTRCYPGSCSNELASNCVCTKGFSGTHCEQMTEKATILANECKLKDSSGQILLNPTDPNQQPPQPTVWTNNVIWREADTDWDAKYTLTAVPPTPDPTGQNHYVTDFKYGIVFATTVLTLKRGGSTAGEITYNCPGISERSPKTTGFKCKTTHSFNSLPTPFKHNDQMHFTIQATIGGYVKVMNRESNNRIDYFSLGRTKQENQYLYHWDLINPYHCVASGSGCPQFLTVVDLTENPSITMTWDGWNDDLSGLLKYQYEVFQLGHDGSNLGENQGKLVKSATDVALNDADASFTLTEPGMYAIHFAAFDKAGNWKTSRKVLLFDDQSVITQNPAKVTRVVTASTETNYLWVVEDTNTVVVRWTDRFRNARHENNRWLNKVSSYTAVESKYDDHYGERQVDKIDNVHACINFQVSYEVNDGTGVQNNRALTSVSNIHEQADTLNLVWYDGNRLNVTVKAFDVLGKTLEETITVYRDATPPIIEDLWLTRGDRLNVSVHRIEDFAQMTIEWLAYDYHSGLDRIYWRLYDNYTGSVILHGHEDIPAQGMAVDQADCVSKYGSYPRGANCYVTPFWGAYHKHFQVKPAIKLAGGLKVGKDQGVHDSDYYLEVSATSKAELTTVLTKKITIDTSPPHTGIVQDGVKGTAEVDYQQSKTLNAHWDGFFDRESGILFYQYGFNTSHIPASEFALDTGNTMLHETYSLHATHTVTTEGTYYICVVAYNRALEPSLPICSDGVTVTTVVPSVEEVIVEGASITGGLLTDSAKTNYWVITSNRLRRLIKDPIADCTTKATVMSDLNLLPAEHYDNGSFVEVDGSIFCSNTSGAPSVLSPMLSKSSMLYGCVQLVIDGGGNTFTMYWEETTELQQLFLQWSDVANPGSVHDYEVGFSSTSGSASPDIMAFRSTKQHRHITIMHSDVPDGSQFYIIIKTISKANVEGLQTVGPCYMDTTAPVVTGSITVTHNAGYLIASWSSGTFTDAQEPYTLDLKFAIGHSPRGTDVMYYKSLTSGGSCTVGATPTCTAIKVSDTDWRLHGHHTYYVTIKARNSAGLTTYAVSSAYVHDVQLATKGIVIDIEFSNMASIPLQDIEDIDFTTTKTSLTARWSGFSHPFLTVTYKFKAGTTPGGSDTVSEKDVGTSLSHSETGLSLVSFQTYYVTITGVTSAGNVAVTSDGLTIVQENAPLSGIVIYDGEPCNMTADNGTLFKHHGEDNRFQCQNDIDVQSSTNTLKAYWSIPSNMAYYTPDVHFAVEERSPIGAVWTSFRDYEHIHDHNEAKVSDLILKPGRTYRVAVKICAIATCYAPLYSDGVIILANPPYKGQLTVDHLNTTQGGGKEKININMERFYDPDTQDETEKYDAIEKYEWAITDQSDVGRIHTKWTKVQNIQLTQANKWIRFEVELDGEFDFSKCRRLSVRGYNKAKLYSSVSMDVKDCKAFDPILVKANHVIDAVGTTGTGDGAPVFLQENAKWTESDKDYTPNSNYISAVWPQLRYNSYVAAVLNAKSVDVTSYYLPTNALSLPDPCSHPDAIKCDTTNAEFINFKFNPGELVHGQRYMVCIHTVYTEIKHEKWTQVLPELNVCSDGVVVDLTPPTPGAVWIGNVQGTRYQTSSTDMYVNWESFQDVEEFNTISHSSGIQNYQLGIGTSIGGNDMVAFFSVGVVNHAALHGLMLQSGHTYYATIKATDYANRTTIKTSDPVVVDTSPPLKSDKSVTITGRHIVSNSEIEACWKNVFSDPESEVNYYMWGIGSQPGYDDIMEYTRVDTECGENSKTNPLDLREGHAYYISVKAFNKAGLMSLASSWAYIVDLSPPVAGHIYDGKQTANTNLSDTDYQTDMSALHVYWEGFYDPHSAIQDYFISVGTCLNCQDVIGQQAIGIVNEFSLDHVHFGAGLTYYTSLTACNTADFCTTVTTDGVIMDNSPPSMGVVMDGTTSHDIEYQSIRTFLSAKWYGFVDPQSGLDRYVWWAGTTQGGNDVIAEKEIHLTQVATVYNLSPQLPVAQRIYVTVRAYNRAGLYTDATSDGFVVDTSAPVISDGPKFSQDFGISGDAQFFRTIMKVEWTVSDPESYIERQYLSLKSHLGGEFDLASTTVNGIARDFILSGLKLHDGVTYYVNLISCNGAQICSTKTTTGILVDTTPPSRGMFAIHTDHAAELERQVSGWMTWSSYAIRLAWLGFADIHSDVTHYYINVGSTYLGSNLNENTGPLRVDHTNTGESRYDEGRVQTYSVKTKKIEATIQYLYISVWAVNKAGLSSAIIHSKFEKIPGGTLSLVRRCVAETCEGQCVCAPQDKLCHTSGASCSDISNGNTNNVIQVYDVRYGSDDIDYTSASAVLQGFWSIVHRQGNPPLWYQWSVGYTIKSTPEGIFNIATERVWHDAGQNDRQIYTTVPGIYLTDTVQYSFFIRAWYDSNTYAIFKSDGVVIATTKPSTTVIQGSAVSESMLGNWMKDQDFMKNGYPFTVDWTNKFLDAANSISSFRLYLSTYPGGHDVWDSGVNQAGSLTKLDVKRATLIPGVKYYSNIIAYGLSGLHHTESSDGFTTDKAKPVTGIVFDGIGLHDLEYQNTTEVNGAKWHGFTDVGSGIINYYWCVGSSTAVDNRKKGRTECSERGWENVGVHTSVSRNLTTDLKHGKIYYNKVYAEDSVGYESDIVVSDGFKVDLTPPEPQYLLHMGQNLAENPSFESSANVIMVSNVNNSDICNETVDFHPESWNLTAGSCAAVVASDKNLARDGRTFLFLRGSVTQSIDSLVVGGLYRLNFFTSHLLISSSTQSNKEGFATLGSQRHVFMLYTKAYRGDEHGKSETREIISWHKHTFYFLASDTSTNLTIGSVDEKTGIFVDNLVLEHVERSTTNGTGNSHVQAHVVYLHQWGSIHGSWSFVEEISPITEYLWAIGYTKGGTQLQGFESAGLSNFAYNSKVTLVHNSYVYVTAIATNVAGLQGISYSDPILVDLTPPVIVGVYDGRLKGEDQAAWTDNEISANWRVYDQESGLSFCEWAVGTQPQSVDLMQFQRVPTTQTLAFKDFDYSVLYGKTIYTTVRCENNAGLLSSKSSNGVKVSNVPPSITSAMFQPIPQSLTEYQAQNNYQSVTDNIRLKWSGFQDHIGIEQYKISIQGSDDISLVEKMSFPTGQDVLISNVLNTTLAQGQKNLTAQAINKLLLISDNVYSNLTVYTDKPVKHATKQLTINWHAGNKEFTVSWDGIFTSDHPLYYEVSAGKVEGGGEIVQWQETTLTSITFGLPPTITTWSSLNVFMMVRAVASGGFYEDIKGHITLPP